MFHDTYGRWTILKPAQSRKGKTYWVCRCICGTEREVAAGNLKFGISQSCGCLQRDQRRDLSGQQISQWTVIKKVSQHGKARWLCRCACGTEREVSDHQLVRGRSKSCGCLAPNRREQHAQDLIDTKFERWTVIGPAPSRNGEPYLLCRCACGTEREVRKSALTSGASESCGCIRLNPHREPIWTCHNGHRVTPANTYTYPNGKRRSCRICERDGTNRRRNPETENERKKAHYHANREARRERIAIRRAAMTEEERRYAADNAAKWFQQMDERFPGRPLGTKFTPEEDQILLRNDLSITGMCAHLRAQGTPRTFSAVSQRRRHLLNGGDKPPRRGERNPQAKLTVEEVREIRTSPRTQRELAAIYGVNQSHISAIQLGKRWAHID